MADKKMNEFSPATDANYIYGELADGSQVKINKSDLQKIFAISFTHTECDVNKLQAGEVYITRSVINGPTDSWLYVKTFTTYSSSDAAQIAITIIGSRMWFRTRNNGTWSQWKSVTFT